MVVGVLNEVFPGVTNTFTVEQGAGEEVAEDLKNDILHEAGQVRSSCWRPPPFHQCVVR